MEKTCGMKTSKTREAILQLAKLFEYGVLAAETDPVGFLSMVTDEIKRLREVLAPFAKAAERIPDFGPRAKAIEDILAINWKDGSLPMFGTEFHRARVVLERSG